jgi:hypothetical protein
MIPVVRKAVKILMSDAAQENMSLVPKGSTPFLESMEILKKELEPAEWKELNELTIFGIARTVTLGDVIELVKEDRA